MVMSGTLIVIQPDGSSQHVRIIGSKGPALETLQQHVGGYIERVRVRLDNRVRDAYVDEDGLSKGLAVNQSAILMLAPPFDSSHLIVGPLVVWAPDPKEKSRA
jgi:hypothetical protein